MHAQTSAPFVCVGGHQGSSSGENSRRFLFEGTFGRVKLKLQKESWLFFFLKNKI